MLIPLIQRTCNCKYVTFSLLVIDKIFIIITNFFQIYFTNFNETRTIALEKEQDNKFSFGLEDCQKHLIVTIKMPEFVCLNDQIIPTQSFNTIQC